MVGEHIQVLGECCVQDLLSLPHTLPDTALPSGHPSVTFIISSYDKLVNSKQTRFLSSVSCSSQVIKPEEEVMGTSTLEPTARNQDFRLASKVGEGQPCGTEPLMCPQVDSVRIELNCWTPSWCRGNCLVWKNPPHICVALRVW